MARTVTGATGGRRAPRLTPAERLAPLITRRGRFAARDPLADRPLPGLAKVVGVLGWGAFTGYALLRATRRRARATLSGAAG